MFVGFGSAFVGGRGRGVVPGCGGVFYPQQRGGEVALLLLLLFVWCGVSGVGWGEWLIWLWIAVELAL